MAEFFHEAARGPWGRVVWAEDANGARQAEEYFDALDDGEHAKLQAWFDRLAQVGKIENDQRFKYQDDGIWAFKNYQTRFYGGFRPGGLFVIALGLNKKTDPHDKRAMKRVKRILAEFDSVRERRRQRGVDNG